MFYYDAQLYHKSMGISRQSFCVIYTPNASTHSCHHRGVNNVRLGKVHTFFKLQLLIIQFIKQYVSPQVYASSQIVAVESQFYKIIKKLKYFLFTIK
jgi:hypothetical protein